MKKNVIPFPGMFGPNGVMMMAAPPHGKVPSMRVWQKMAVPRHEQFLFEEVLITEEHPIEESDFPQEVIDFFNTNNIDRYYGSCIEWERSFKERRTVTQLTKEISSFVEPGSWIMIEDRLSSIPIKSDKLELYRPNHYTFKMEWVIHLIQV